MESREQARRRLAELVVEATDGAVDADEVAVPGVSLAELGVGSLGLLRLLDAVEVAYGFEADLGLVGRLDTLDQLIDYLADQDLAGSD
jgi:acyl carrier protein